MRALARTIDADVLVVGGGPAGAATAIGLARAGIAAVVVDRAFFPRSKPCGDCLSPAATAVLERLGVLDALLATSPAWLSGWILRSSTGRILKVGFPGHAPGLAMERRALDAILLRRAAAEGVRVRQGERVVELTRGRDGVVNGARTLAADGRRRTFRTSLVVGADGLRSVVATRVGALGNVPAPRKLSFTAHARELDPRRPERPARDAAGSGAFGELHLGDGLCVGMAPLADAVSGTAEADAAAPRRWNVTVVADARRYRGSAGRDPGAFLRGAVLAAAGGEPRFDWDGAEPRPLASGPFERPVSRVAGAGWALVGDAAGYYDPFTGQGIYQALAGGEMLAAHVAHAPRRERTAEALARGWTAEHRRLTSAARRLQRLIEAVVSRPRLRDLAFTRLAGSRRLADALGATTGDLESAYALLRPDRVAALAGAVVFGGWRADGGSGIRKAPTRAGRRRAVETSFGTHG